MTDGVDFCVLPRCTLRNMVKSSQVLILLIMVYGRYLQGDSDYRQLGSELGLIMALWNIFETLGNIYYGILL